MDILNNSGVRYLLAAQSLTLLIAGWCWWCVGHDPVAAALRRAAEWTAVSLTLGGISAAFIIMLSTS